MPHEPARPPARPAAPTSRRDAAVPRQEEVVLGLDPAATAAAASAMAALPGGGSGAGLRPEDEMARSMDLLSLGGDGSSHGSRGGLHFALESSGHGGAGRGGGLYGAPY